MLSLTQSGILPSPMGYGYRTWTGRVTHCPSHMQSQPKDKAACIRLIERGMHTGLGGQCSGSCELCCRRSVKLCHVNSACMQEGNGISVFPTRSVYEAAQPITSLALCSPVLPQNVFPTKTSNPTRSVQHPISRSSTQGHSLMQRQFPGLAASRSK